jgi:uncharacterized membrane protein
MMLLPHVVTVQIIVLHVPAGYEIRVNAEQIVTLRETSEGSGHANRLLIHGAHCVVGLTSTRFIAVTESCRDVQRRLLEAR